MDEIQPCSQSLPSINGDKVGDQPAALTFRKAPKSLSVMDI